jgi:hypothetical protein
MVGFLVAAGWPAPAQEAANEPYYRLSAAALACFVQHREVYKAASGETVFLLANRCPPKSPPSLLDALTNEGPDVRLADPDALDRLLTLSRAQLACFDRLSVNASDTVVLFFPDACRVEPSTAHP